MDSSPQNSSPLKNEGGRVRSKNYFVCQRQKAKVFQAGKTLVVTERDETQLSFKYGDNVGRSFLGGVHGAAFGCSRVKGQE